METFVDQRGFVRTIDDSEDVPVLDESSDSEEEVSHLVIIPSERRMREIYIKNSTLYICYLYSTWFWEGSFK